MKDAEAASWRSLARRLGWRAESTEAPLKKDKL